MPQSDLTPYELTILREIAEPGSQRGLVWGAAMGTVWERLRASGFITRSPRPVLTAQGETALREGSRAPY